MGKGESNPEPILHRHRPRVIVAAQTLRDDGGVWEWHLPRQSTEETAD